MSVACFIVLEREIPDFEPFVNGKAVAHAFEELTLIAAELGLPGPGEFLAPDPELLDELLDAQEPAPLPADAGSVPWFDPADGVAWVQRLLAHLDTNPPTVGSSRQAQQALMRDLREYLAVLKRAEREGVRWHLQIDF